jgi:hypothetical protein
MFELSYLLQYDLSAAYRDDKERSDSYLACHFEKQLLAHLIFQHTTAFSKLMTRKES